MTAFDRPPPEPRLARLLLLLAYVGERTTLSPGEAALLEEDISIPVPTIVDEIVRRRRAERTARVPNSHTP